MRRLALGLLLGVILASAGTSVAAVGWSWYVEAEGSASGSLGVLSPLDVSDARGGNGLLPGETMSLKVDVLNPNRVALTLVSVEVDDLKSGDDACDVSLADSRLRFDRSPDLSVRPGENDGIVLGAVRLPRLLAQSCMGQDVSAVVNVRAAYGAQD